MTATFRMAATLCVAALFATPAAAGKKDNSIRFAYEQVIDHLDPYFNSVRGGIRTSYSPPTPTKCPVSGK